MRASILVLAACGSAPIATPKPAPVKCAAESRAFDFLLGDFRSTERDATGKAMSTGVIHNDAILAGCAIRESWQIDLDGKRAFDAVLLRSFDPAAKRWWLSYVDDAGHHQLYEGREEAGAWRFHRERIADDGSRVIVRITWTPATRGYVQTIERSTDGGTTWTTGATIDYQPAT